MKTLLSLFLTLFLFGCSSCGPAELETPTDTQEEEPLPYEWATWETCSQVEGDHPCNLTLQDQNGEEVSLYDFYGSPVILDFSAMWCGPCQMAANELQQTVEHYANDDLRYITVLIDNPSGNPPTQTDLEGWATMYGISEPVLGGNRGLIDYSAQSGWNITSWPTFVGITSDMEVHLILKGFSTSLVEYLADETIAASQ